MITTFTSKDVLRYFYGEFSKLEKEAIEEELAYNKKLQKIYCEIEATTTVLNKTIIKPNKNVIDNILLYSKSFATVQ